VLRRNFRHPVHWDPGWAEGARHRVAPLYLTLLQ